MIIKNRITAKVTVIANRFIDEYMADANGEFLKVYLYLLRLSQDMDTEISFTGIADHLNHTEKDVQRALRYWEKQGWLTLQVGPGRKLETVEICDPSEKKMSDGEKDQSSVESTVVSAERQTPAKRPMTPELMEQLTADDEFTQVITMAEMYLGRTLTPKDLQMFAYLYEDLHFTEDLLEYLVGYCVEGGHRSNRYIETVALGWHKEGLMTVEQAKEAHQAYNKENKAVMKAFGITGRILNNEERSYVNKWVNTWHMSLELIVEACQITLAATQKGSFPYADKILSDWKEAGIKTLEHAQQYREKRKNVKSSGQSANKNSEGGNSRTSKNGASNRFQNYQEREIDYDALLNQGGMNLYDDGEH